MNETNLEWKALLSALSLASLVWWLVWWLIAYACRRKKHRMRFRYWLPASPWGSKWLLSRWPPLTCKLSPLNERYETWFLRNCSAGFRNTCWDGWGGLYTYRKKRLERDDVERRKKQSGSARARKEKNITRREKKKETALQRKRNTYSSTQHKHTTKS